VSAPAVVEISTELGFTYERMAPFHGRTVELWALET
jgi:hypothetical protein